MLLFPDINATNFEGDSNKTSQPVLLRLTRQDSLIGFAFQYVKGKNLFFEDANARVAKMLYISIKWESTKQGSNIWIFNSFLPFYPKYSSPLPIKKS